MQTDWPEVLKVPAPHDMQAVDELLPLDGLYVPAAQAVQFDRVTLPFNGLYVPAEQAIQAAAEVPLIDGL